ncbi:alpha/beta fold hydrolase [Glutamicibacter protophormiae]|uniref:alpha/beta hydrolase n=1 Tax=Kocuria TaxID=57493 RepID=UPI0006D84365|nr:MULTISPECIES: alpha/beta fold hydrolase [Kocuria]MDN5632434.1 lysophospholipase [Kocuria sp.]RUP83123.1 alpha/beta fold hydrolase [Kocuria sp. HSID17590]WNB89839.1 alpha/beta fold hydrolase [Glutamicibacter protophormiae]
MASETSPRPGTDARAWRHGALVGAAASVGAASATFALSGGVAALVARHVVTPSTRPGNVTVLKLEKDPNSGQDLVTLPATPDTRVAGTYALRFDEGRGLARIGFVVRQTGGTVTRLVERVYSGELSVGARGWWTGTVYARPSDAGLPYEDVQIPTPLGAAPAWFVPAEVDDAARAGTWAVMVHGRGAQRAECIRGARVARRLGLHSLLLSYRNDGEAPATPDHRYGLGFTEWEDVQAGIRYALEHGAMDVVLFGWSMGGAIVLRTAELTEHRDRLRALVLTGPVVDWYELLAHQTKVHRVPRRVGRMAADMISHRLGPRITGLAAPLDLHALDWLSRWEDIATPTLILHSTDDEVVPVAGSVKLADRSSLVDFVGFTGARHTKEWNIDRKRYERAIEKWLPQHLGSQRSGPQYPGPQ